MDGLVSDLITLKTARDLLDSAIAEEEFFGEGDGANYIVFNHAQALVTEYLDAINKGII